MQVADRDSLVAVPALVPNQRLDATAGELGGDPSGRTRRSEELMELKRKEPTVKGSGSGSPSQVSIDSIVGRPLVSPTARAVQSRGRPLVASALLMSSTRDQRSGTGTVGHRTT
jgi:hypothetical protein